MGEPQPELGVMAAPEELIDALHALGAIRAPSRAERARIERQSASRELLRLECAHHLAGVVEMQVLMAAGAAADAIEEPADEDSTRVLMAGWESYQRPHFCRRPHATRRRRWTRARVLSTVVTVPHSDPLEHRGTPERSPDQRMDALNQANEVRTRRAALKRDLKAGRASLGELLLDPPAFLETAKVLDMLQALPKVGEGQSDQDPQRPADRAQQDVRRPDRPPAR
jgi:hypothetical protein